MIIGELIAGLVVGKTGFGVVDAANPTFQLFANIGFALVMFIVGTHVPVRGHEMRSAVPLALARVLLGGVIAAVLAIALAALAVSTHVSIMLAGFSVGLVIAVVGEPRRLARQLFGITEGFFSPLFFVWLGASLQVRELGLHPKLILLGVSLGLGAVLVHGAGRLLGQPLTLAVLSAGQLGVPVAAATIGTEEHLLVTGEASALMFGALLTITCASIAGALAARGQTVSEPDKSAQTDKPT